MGKRFWVKQSIALLCALLFTAGAVMAVSTFGEFQKNCDSLSPNGRRFTTGRTDY